MRSLTLFQSLIGWLQTFQFPYVHLPCDQFQSLIGWLQTTEAQKKAIWAIRFQSLIGWLQTETNALPIEPRTYVSIPYRLATNASSFAKFGPDLFSFNPL